MPQAHPDQPRQQTSVVTTESPPPRQAVIPTTQFVTIENDKTAQARAWAIQQLAHRYPGVTGFIESETALINQYLEAQR